MFAKTKWLRCVQGLKYGDTQLDTSNLSTAISKEIDQLEEIDALTTQTTVTFRLRIGVRAKWSVIKFRIEPFPIKIPMKSCIRFRIRVGVIPQ